MSNKILIICHNYLPIETPNSFRWARLAEALAKQGHEVYMISAWKLAAERAAILNGVRVFRVGGGLSQRIRQIFVGRHDAMALNQAQTSGRLTAKQKIIVTARRLHNITWKMIYWPDYACLWYLAARIKACELVERHRITKLISVSFPFTDHLVGYGVKRRYPGITWLAEMLDPAFFPDIFVANNHALYRKLNLAVEKEVFRKAQVVMITTGALRQRYASLYPDAGHKIFVTPQAMTDKLENIDSYFPRDSKIRMIFVGSFYKTIREPKFLLQVFEMLTRTRVGERLQLHFFGNIYPCLEQFAAYRQFMGRQIFLNGQIGREQALQIMYSADILVNIGNTNPFQEPSKVVECAGMGKPIVNFVTIPNDSSALALERYPAVLNIFCPIPEEKKICEIDKLIDFIACPPRVDAESLAEWRASHAVEDIAASYLALLGHK